MAQSSPTRHVLASGPVNSGQVKVELVTPTGKTPFVVVTWLLKPSAISPAAYSDAAAQLCRLFAARSWREGADAPASSLKSTTSTPVMASGRVGYRPHRLASSALGRLKFACLFALESGEGPLEVVVDVIPGCLTTERCPAQYPAPGQGGDPIPETARAPT